MRKGIVRDFVWVHASNLGTVAIEDMETHGLVKLPYDKKLNPGKYRDKVVYWGSDQSGMLTRLELLDRS